MNPELIAFEGAQSSAKSTRSRTLTQVLRDVGYIVDQVPELARNWNPEELHNPEDPLTLQASMLDAQINVETRLKTAEGLDYIILDRTVLSPLAYAWYFFARGKYGPRSRSEAFTLWDNLAQRVEKYLRETENITRIYVCKPRPIYADGFRDTNPEFQQGVYDAFTIVLARVIPSSGFPNVEVKILD